MSSSHLLWVYPPSVYVYGGIPFWGVDEGYRAFLDVFFLTLKSATQGSFEGLLVHYTVPEWKKSATNL